MHHVPSDMLELYALGRVPERDLVTIEEHLLICPRCCVELEDVAGFAHTIGEALRNFTPELMETHDTSDGVICLYVRRSSERWIATLRGPKADGGVFGSHRREVIVAISRLFWGMFPEHECTSRCMQTNEQQSIGS